MSLIVLAVGAGCVAIAGFAVGVLGRTACPACGTKLLRRVERRRVTEIETSWIESRYACESCLGEFMRRNDGPFVPRHQWEQGMRDGIPPAKLLR